MHNGFIDGFAAIKRDLVLAVNDPLFERGQIAVAVLQPRRPHGQRAISRTTCPAAAVRRRRFVVSEPIGDLPGTWVELPEASYGVFRKGVTSSCPSPPDHHRKPSYGRRASQPPSQARQAVMEPVPSSAGLRRVPSPAGISGSPVTPGLIPLSPPGQRRTHKELLVTVPAVRERDPASRAVSSPRRRRPGRRRTPGSGGRTAAGRLSAAGPRRAG